MQLTRYADVLRAVGFALSTAYAMVGLPQTRHGAVKADEVVSPQPGIVFSHTFQRQRALVLAFIVMHKQAWDVDAIGARHAVFAVVARNGL